MKILLFAIFVFQCHTLSAQKYAVMDRSFFKSLQFTDSVTDKDLKKERYIFYTADYDSLLAGVKSLLRLKEQGMKKENIDMGRFESHTLKFVVVTQPLAYGYRYDIRAIADTDKGKFSYRVSNSTLNLADNQLAIRRFYNYLVRKNN